MGNKRLPDLVEELSKNYNIINGIVYLLIFDVYHIFIIIIYSIFYTRMIFQEIFLALRKIVGTSTSNRGTFFNLCLEEVYDM